MPAAGPGDGGVEAFAFYDYAHLWSATRATGDTNETDQLSSAGIGLRANAGAGLTAEVHWAKRFHDPPSEPGNDLQDRGVHFRIGFDAARGARRLYDAVTSLGQDDGSDGDDGQ